MVDKSHTDTVMGIIESDHKIARNEIFGPVLIGPTFSSDGESIAMANDTIYGLAASVWTSYLSRALGVSGALNAGAVSVNAVDALSAMPPFGGMKQSGNNGRDLSIHSFEKYTALKTAG